MGYNRTPMEAPLVKATSLRAQIDAIRSQPGGPEALAASDQLLLKQVEQAARTELLPAEIGVHLYEEFLRLEGDDAVRAAGRQIGNKLAEIPLFAPLIRVAVNMFGKGPKSLVAALPNGVKASGRNTADVTYEETGPTSLRTTWRNIPEPLRRRAWLLSVEGTHFAILDLAGKTGRVTADDRDFVRDGVLHFDVEWS